MAEKIPSLAPMIEVSPPPPAAPDAPPVDLMLGGALLFAGVLLAFWQRRRLWLGWLRLRLDRHNAQHVARLVLVRCAPDGDRAIELQKIAFAPDVSHETVRQLKTLLQELAQ